jgi:hypothetical protein
MDDDGLDECGEAGEFPDELVGLEVPDGDGLGGG